ncbi:MAG TPA: DUF1236 domain-containing protein [Microvirga sp.]|nr:DUF1236 domain-containing protein [Microvirga sp.]
MVRPNALSGSASKRLLMLVFAFVGTGSPALAQTTGGPTLGTVVESPTPPMLPPEKQAIIREQAKRPDLPIVQLSEPARIDMTIPEEVELLALPQDITTETPTTTSYRYLITSDAIAVVEPQSRRVIQIITR